MDKIGVAQEMLKIFLRDDGVKKKRIFFPHTVWNILFLLLLARDTATRKGPLPRKGSLT